MYKRNELPNKKTPENSTRIYLEKSYLRARLPETIDNGSIPNITDTLQCALDSV